ncbi:MAG: hypothetical protein HDQ98_08205 [Lachnospiraceae bacterium]|nr:hypothetical protein [Lachnospiraceae bacterium]
MRTLYKLELEKLFRRLSVLICLVFLLAYGIVIYDEWVDPFGKELYLMDEDGTIRHGRDAIRLEREWMEPYRGVLTDAHVEEISQISYRHAGQLVTYLQQMIESGTQLNEMDMPYAERVITHFFLAEEVSQREYIENGRTVENSISITRDTPLQIGEIFSDGVLPLRLEYSPPWSGMMESMIILLFLLNLAVLLVISPVFSEEHTRQMNALLFTSKLGKRKCFRAKAAAAYSIGIFSVLTIILLHVLVTFLLFGEDGLAGSIQISGEYLFYGDFPYVKTVGSAIFDAALLYSADVLFAVSLTVLGSVLASNVLSGMVISLAFWMAPMVLKFLDAVPRQVKMIAPVVHKTDFNAVLRLPDVTFGPITMQYNYAAAGVLVLLSVLITLCAAWIYRHGTGE